VSGNVLVDLGCGEGVFSEGKRVDGNIIIRVKEDLYVEFKLAESEKVLR
jgi:prefoldin subunit 5